MTIRLLAGPSAPWLHVLKRNDDEDRRLGWTRCGIRFAWGGVDLHRSALPRCKGCA